MKQAHIENVRGQVIAFLDGKGRHCTLAEPLAIADADQLDIDDADVIETGPGRGRVNRTRPRGPRGAEDLHQAEAKLADGLAAAES